MDVVHIIHKSKKWFNKFHYVTIFQLKKKINFNTFYHSIIIVIRHKLQDYHRTLLRTVFFQYHYIGNRNDSSLLSDFQNNNNIYRPVHRGIFF